MPRRRQHRFAGPCPDELIVWDNTDTLWRRTRIKRRGRIGGGPLRDRRSTVWNRVLGGPRDRGRGLHHQCQEFLGTTLRRNLQRRVRAGAIRVSVSRWNLQHHFWHNPTTSEVLTAVPQNFLNPDLVQVTMGTLEMDNTSNKSIHLSVEVNKDNWCQGASVAPISIWF